MFSGAGSMMMGAASYGLGPAIQGITGLAGAGMSNKLQKEMFYQNLRWEREKFERSLLRNRVVDARRAGIHPLYAMGQSPVAGFPVTAFEDKVGPALADMGQNIGGAVNRMLDQQSRDKQALELALGQKQLDVMDAQAQMYRSEAMRNMQAGAPPGLGVQQENGIGPQIEGQNPVVPGIQPMPDIASGYIDVKPSDVVSPRTGQPDVRAGLNPTLELRSLGKDFPIYLPISQNEAPEEIISEMNPLTWAGLLAWNARKFGKDWLGDLISKRYFGHDPFYRYSMDGKRLGFQKGDIPLGKPEDYRKHLPWWQLETRDLVKPWKDEWRRLKRKFGGLSEKFERNWDRFFHPTTAWEREQARKKERR